MWQAVAYNELKSRSKKLGASASRKSKELGGIQFSQIVNVLLILCGAFIVYKVYNIFFGDDLVVDENLNTAETETIENINSTYVNENDLTINHTQADTIKLQILKELKNAQAFFNYYSEAKINSLLVGLTKADLTLILKKFGVQKYEPIFGNVEYLSCKKYASKVLTDNDFQHFSSHFKNVTAFI